MTAFIFRVGDRVVDTRVGKVAKVIDRTIEAALHKTYLIRYRDGRCGGYTPEADLVPYQRRGSGDRP